MNELAHRRPITQSGVTRVADADDGRSWHAALTRSGLRKLRDAQVTHHQVARGLVLGNLSDADQRALARLLERANPGVATEDVWPPPAGDGGGSTG